MSHATSDSPLALLQKQRSHVLFVLSNPQPNSAPEFLQWYQGHYRQAVLGLAAVLSGQQYERHEVDVTRGRWPPPPFRYVGIYDLCLDGAEAAQGVIEQITGLHLNQPAAEAPATWLYRAVSEKVGRAPAQQPAPLILAFANGLPGQETEFQEWYATRHIRHALSISVMASGQCFERTLFQRPGAMEAEYNTIAVYEHTGTPEEFLASAAQVPKGTLSFPMLDLSRFGESVYRSLPCPV